MSSCLKEVKLPSALLLLAITGLGVIAGLVVWVCLLWRRLAALKSQTNQLAEALDHVHAFVYMKDSERRYIYANRLTLERLGLTTKQLYGTRATDHFQAATAACIDEVDKRVLTYGESSSDQVVYGDDPATALVYLEVKEPFHDPRGRVVGLLGISTDMTEIRRLERELELRSTTDYLTGLANRRFFDERLTLALKHQRRAQGPTALLLLDIDHFKKYNDTYGHSAGDAVLQAVAAALLGAVARTTDFVARVGGEEFAMLLDGTGLQGAQQIAEAARAGVQRCGLLHEKNSAQVVTISIGIAMATPDEDPTHLYQKADRALYAAKESGRNRVCTA
ncbi:hypothetical protein C6571_01930 [Simplicispira suum]|uniref:diguanylate cyclase n=1 Tax=Simplicispira suum TaxID=2109915 RepID=A0A2S0MWN0_9BURK|nr:hypothetical protein C6571_01930 [Simplicispira suum]